MDHPQQSRGHLAQIAGEQRAAVAQPVDSFTRVSRQVTERVYGSFVEGFAEDFTPYETNGEVRSWG